MLDQGIYTACEPCKAHPEWPPEWQVRAAKIIENQQTHIIYFENAWVDVYGIPIAYVPFASAPDPTVTRQSGVLAPFYTTQTSLGLSVSVPYFLALAPNYDLTITPSYYSLQGPALDAALASTAGLRRIQRPRQRHPRAGPLRVSARPLRSG